jgi:sporulation protein YlmC with PRC-barrel domain
MAGRLLLILPPNPKAQEIKMRTLLLASTAAFMLSQAAIAQTPSTTNDTANQAGSSQHMRSNLKGMLEKAGYKDVSVVPTGFVIHAKDADGNAVVMSVRPDSFTEFTDVNTTTDRSTTGLAANNPGSSEQFVSVPNNDELSSKVVGLDIYNGSNQDIGQIKDIAINQNGRAQAYIVSVGGFLGLGEHYVAVNPLAVKVSYNDTDKKWHALMNATADQLKAAPEFKYSERWQASRM